MPHRHLITSALPYINSVKHLGKAAVVNKAGSVWLADVEPWKHVEADRNRAAMTIRTALNLVRLCAVLSAPIVPGTSARGLDGLEATPAERRWPSGWGCQSSDLANGGPALEGGGARRPHRLPHRHHDQQSADDRNRIFDEGRGRIAAERGGQPRAEGAAAQGADDRTGDAERSSGDARERRAT